MSIRDVEDLLAQFPDDHADIAMELRELVIGVLGDPEERVYTGWKGLGYHTQAGYVCGIFLSDSGVRLGFEHGLSLNDPEDLLVGTGKQVRYLEILDWTPAIRERAEHFLRQTALGS